MKLSIKMRPYSLPLLIALILICLTSFADDEADKQKWKEETISYLKAISPTNTTRMAEIQIRGAAQVLRYYIENEGLIKFGTNGWVYLKMHSSCYPTAKGSVGDIVLAIDQDGNLYQNDGHVCDGILLVSVTGKEFQSIQEFLNTQVVKEKWRKLSGLVDIKGGF